MKICKFCCNEYIIENYIHFSCYFCRKCNYYIYYTNKLINYIKIYNSYYNANFHIEIDYTYKKIICIIYNPRYKTINIPISFIKFEEIEDLEAFKNRIKLYLKLI